VIGVIGLVLAYLHVYFVGTRDRDRTSVTTAQAARQEGVQP
jgi:hypothetical protein